ncbi:MAG: bifunctional glutamate N-acetyltransferase/amino-acid acetyltransferase ArgJ [Anaerolineae bacterium]|nr:bifunctional glutamate N-acetyltransferase/amino-acid acetyltransferase ArgJ [Anaerolineae bacterium]
MLDNPSLTLVPGFRAAAVHARVKASSPPEKLDVAVVASDTHAVAAGVFTTNRVKAAPVSYDQTILARNTAGIRAVVINSGNANAVTGAQGLADAHTTAEVAAAALGVEADSILVMSTGVIGQMLPLDRLLPGVTAAVNALDPAADAGHRVARAIMTTDTFPKEAAARVTVAGRTVTLAGVAKGAGLSAPHMATLLSVIVTDVAIRPAALRAALEDAAGRSFNCVTVDGDMSTNDTLLVLANGRAGNPVIDDPDSPGYTEFLDGLRQVSAALARMIARDGEGATKFVTIRVTGAPSWDVARQVGLAVGNSSLVKTALHGEDANWGRVLCAVGYSGAEVDPTRLALWFDEVQLVRDGAPTDYQEADAHATLTKPEVLIRIDLGQGDAEAEVWTCDLSYDYVRINADYRT